MHVSGKKLAKTVIVKVDGLLAMAVVPTSHHLDLDLLRAAAGASMVEVATEQEFKDAFPDCETGAMPTLGNLYDTPVYVDRGLGEQEGIIFNPGAHRELAHGMDGSGAAGEPANRYARPKSGCAAA